MVQRVLGLMRERSKTPMETISASGLVAVLSLGPTLSNHAEVPFKFCGHVYVNPPREVYMAVFIVSLLTFTKFVLSAVLRCLVTLCRRNHERRTAHLVPCVGIAAHGNSCALYKRQWWVFTSIGFFCIFPGITPWFLDFKIMPLYQI